MPHAGARANELPEHSYLRESWSGVAEGLNRADVMGKVTHYPWA